MNAHDIQPLLDWVGSHPGWAGIVAFLIAFTESLLVVGLVVPGVVLLFGLGALIGSGHLPFWPTVIWAGAGAFAGDLASFLLGYHYHDQLRRRWPLKNFPALYDKGHAFFARHGGKSVVLGRFVGAVRPVIPAVAGMAGMTLRRFIFIDALSSIAWAPAYLLPGIIFGASLGIAAQVTTRLATLMVAVVVVLWLAYVAVRWFARLLQPACDRAMAYGLVWAQRHRKVGPFAESLLKEHAAELPGVLAFGLLLAGLGWMGFRIALTLRGDDAAGFINGSVYHLLLQVHTPWAEPVAQAFARWTDWPAWVETGCMAMALLWLTRRRRAAVHVFAATVFGALLDLALLPLISAPIAMSEHIPSHLTPPATVVGALAVYGFLAALLATRLARQFRWPIYAAVTLILTISVFARLYLGTLWLGGAAGSLLLGLAWTVVLTAGYRSHRETRHAPVSLAILWSVGLLAILLAAPAWLAARGVPSARLATTQSVAADAWWNGHWHMLPGFAQTTRVSVNGKTPTIQFAGKLTALAQRLENAGWSRPIPLSSRTALRWVSKAADISELPLLPSYVHGHSQVLQLTHASPIDGSEWVLQLWQSDWTVDGAPLYIGDVTEFRVSGRFFLLSIPLRERTGMAEGTALFERALPPSNARVLTQPDGRTVLLIRFQP